MEQVFVLVCLVILRVFNYLSLKITPWEKSDYHKRGKTPFFTNFTLISRLLVAILLAATPSNRFDQFFVYIVRCYYLPTGRSPARQSVQWPGRVRVMVMG